MGAESRGRCVTTTLTLFVRQVLVRERGCERWLSNVWLDSSGSPRRIKDVDRAIKALFPREMDSRNQQKFFFEWYQQTARFQARCVDHLWHFHVQLREGQAVQPGKIVLGGPLDFGQ